jgi:RNA polymerase sigma-70 factor, ECF subfamily
LGYLEGVDAASPQSGESGLVISVDRGAEEAGPLLEDTAETGSIPRALLDELWGTARGAEAGLTPAEFEQVLHGVGAKHNFSLPAGTVATTAQRGSFYRGLQLADLALARACALGRDAAWQTFLARYRGPLKQAAISMTRSSSLGEELADSLYSELFGLREHKDERRSPLASYTGRGSLMGWLRTTLAQRYVDHHRRTHRESPIEDQDFAAASASPATPPEMLARLTQSLDATLRGLAAEDRFMLSAYFLDQHTLLEIARVLRVHEATVSRRLKRLTANLHKQVLKHMEACGMSRRAAEEALGADPRDVDLNLRTLLQSSPTTAFSQQAPPADST